MAERYLKKIRTVQPKLAAAFRAKVKTVTVRTLRSRPTEEAERFSHAAKILSSKALENRALTYTITGSNGGPTWVTVYNAKNKDRQIGGKRGGIRFNFGRNRQDHDIVLKAASTLARFLERWPHVLSFCSGYTNTIAAVALELTSPRANRFLPTISYDLTRSFYVTIVTGIDSDSGKPYRVNLQVRPSKIVDFKIPDIPESECVYFPEMTHARTKSVNNATAKLAAIRTIPEEDKRHEAAIKILRLLLWKYHKKIMKLSDVEYGTEEMILKYAKRSQGSRGPYEGSRLYQLGTHVVRPSEAVNRDTNPKLPEIYLVENRGPSVLRVFNAIDSAWISTGDLKKSWLAGWISARTVNEEINAAKYT